MDPPTVTEEECDSVDDWDEMDVLVPLQDLLSAAEWIHRPQRRLPEPDPSLDLQHLECFDLLTRPILLYIEEICEKVQDPAKVYNKQFMLSLIAHAKFIASLPFTNDPDFHMSDLGIICSRHLLGTDDEPCHTDKLWGQAAMSFLSSGPSYDYLFFVFCSTQLKGPFTQFQSDKGGLTNLVTAFQSFLLPCPPVPLTLGQLLKNEIKDDVLKVIKIEGCSCPRTCSGRKPPCFCASNTPLDELTREVRDICERVGLLFSISSSVRPRFAMLEIVHIWWNKDWPALAVEVCPTQALTQCTFNFYQGLQIPLPDVTQLKKSRSGFVEYSGLDRVIPLGSSKVEYESSSDGEECTLSASGTLVAKVKESSFAYGDCFVTFKILKGPLQNICFRFGPYYYPLEGRVSGVLVKYGFPEGSVSDEKVL